MPFGRKKEFLSSNVGRCAVMQTLISVVLLAAVAAVAGGQSKEAKPSDGNTAKLPADIDPVTFSRFPPVQREDMKESAAHDALHPSRG